MEECPIDNSSVELIPAQGVEEVFVRKDGTLFPVICAVAPLSKGGRTVGAVIEFRDVTEERKREDERLSALREAEEHQRKRAAEAEAFRIKQERFIDTVCHELRNPVRVSISLLILGRHTHFKGYAAQWHLWQHHPPARRA